MSRERRSHVLAVDFVSTSSTPSIPASRRPAKSFLSATGDFWPGLSSPEFSAVPHAETLLLPVSAIRGLRSRSSAGHWPLEKACSLSLAAGLAYRGGSKR